MNFCVAVGFLVARCWDSFWKRVGVEDQGCRARHRHVPEPDRAAGQESSGRSLSLGEPWWGTTLMPFHSLMRSRMCKSVYKTHHLSETAAKLVDRIQFTSRFSKGIYSAQEQELSAQIRVASFRSWNIYCHKLQPPFCGIPSTNISLSGCEFAIYICNIQELEDEANQRGELRTTQTEWIIFIQMAQNPDFLR